MTQNTTHVVDRDDGGVHDECGGHYWFRKYCGVFVCDKCGDHKGLGNCFCGWNKGRGEKLEGEECDEYFGDEPTVDGWYRECGE